MFIGHWAPAFVAATHPRAPKLGTLFIAAQLVDWGFFALLLSGTEKMRVAPGITAMNPMDLYHMPYTHSLLGSAVWAAGFALLVWLARRDLVTAGIAAMVVLSHWLLDLLVHGPDLTLAGSPPKFGMGLWNYPAIEIPLELGLTFGAMAWFLRQHRGPSIPAAVLAVLLATLQAFNWFAPPATKVDISTSLLAFFAYGLATLAAVWLGRSHTLRNTRPQSYAWI